MAEFDPKEERRFRARLRDITCRKCGSMSTRRVPGSDRSLDQATHFEDVVYQVCDSCGHEESVKPRKGELAKNG